MPAHPTPARPSRRTRATLRTLGALLLAAGALGACETMDLAPGDRNDIYVVADAELWAQVQDTMGAALQPTVLTVTDELAFQVVHTDPAGPGWSRLRKFKQLLLVGTPDDPWIAAAMAEADRTDVSPPEVFQTTDVWSRNQLVTVLVVSADDPGQVRSQLPYLAELYDTQYRRWATERMFVSGRDSALADTLASEHGFTMLFPDVYKWSRRDSTFIFRNDNPSPDELIREIRVTWRVPVPDSLAPVFEADSVVAWRQHLGERTLTVDQLVDTSRVRSREMEYRGHPAFEVQAIWQNPPSADWPAAGPFITRLVACEAQDRLYLLDAWLYAPGRDKYEYMIQLNTILDSVRCGS